MEQQKITQNPPLTSHSNLNHPDLTTAHQKTLRSLHNVSASNIHSKSKLSPGPQFVISYNFQNDPNSQVRTHNLLIGLGDIDPNQPKKNTFRKNPALRSKQNSNSHSNVRIVRNNSEDHRNKLIHVRSNQILSSQNNKPETTGQSFYKDGRFKSQDQQSMTHGNTFWKNDRNSYEDPKKNHERYINSNVTRIANRKSGSKISKQRNNGVHSIDKISRGKLNRLDRMGDKENLYFKVHQNNVYDFPNSQILEKDQSSRLTKRSKKEVEYNDKLQHILSKVKRQQTRQRLKQAYVKPEPLYQAPMQKNDFKVKFSPQSRSIHERPSVNAKDEANIVNKSLSQHLNETQAPSILNHTKKLDPLKNHNSLSKIDPASKNISEHQKSLIQKENKQKPKRKYHHLIKNPKKKDSLFDEFHRIQSENSNELGSSKKPSKHEIQQNPIQDKSFQFSVKSQMIQNPPSFKPSSRQNALPQPRPEIILQKLQFKNIPTPNKSPNKSEKQASSNAKSFVKPQKSLQSRNNYHASTTSEVYQNKKTSNQHQRLNSSGNSHNLSGLHEKDEVSTKRKVPVDYKEFLRLLSEENQRKKELEEMERQRELSVNAQKTSRFQNIEEQNEHIKRILAPIGHSFMEERRKRLSDERKSKRKQKKQQMKNINGSIIESDSESDGDPRKSYSKRLAKKNKDNKKNNHVKVVSNLEPITNQKTLHFPQSLLTSVEKIKKESELTSQNISRLEDRINKIQEENSLRSQVDETIPRMRKEQSTSYNNIEPQNEPNMRKQQSTSYRNIEEEETDTNKIGQRKMENKTELKKPQNKVEENKRKSQNQVKKFNNLQKKSSEENKRKSQTQQSPQNTHAENQQGHEKVSHYISNETVQGNKRKSNIQGKGLKGKDQQISRKSKIQESLPRKSAQSINRRSKLEQNGRKSKTSEENQFLKAKNMDSSSSKPSRQGNRKSNTQNNQIKSKQSEVSNQKSQISDSDVKKSNLGGNSRNQSESNNSKNKNQQLYSNQSDINNFKDQTSENNTKAKFNEVEFTNPSQISNADQNTQKIVGRKETKKQNTIQKITGMKIPEKAIQRAKSKRNYRYNNDELDPNNPKPVGSNSGFQHSDDNIDSKGEKSKNRFSKNAGTTSKNPNGKKMNPRSSQESSHEATSNPKLGKHGKVTPVDKRTAQQKQRKFKNWEESQKTQKSKKQQKKPNKNDKNPNQKNWKEAQKQGKKAKGKGKSKNENETGTEQEEQIQESGEPGKKQLKKKPKQVKKTKTNENGVEMATENTDSDDDVSDDEDENDLTEYENKSGLGKDRTSEGENENAYNRQSGNEASNDKKKKKKKDGQPSIHNSIENSEENQPEVSKGEQTKKVKNSQQPQNEKENLKNVQQKPSSNRPSIQEKIQGFQNHSKSSDPKKQIRNSNDKSDPKRSSQENNMETESEQIAEEKKQEMIQNVIENKQMQENGIMEITDSKFEIYNHESEKSFLHNSLQQITEMQPQELQKRAQIVKFLYSLPAEYQSEITNFIPNDAEERIISRGSFAELHPKDFQSVKTASLKNTLEELSILDSLNPKRVEKKGKNRNQGEIQTNFLCKLFEPYPNLNREVGVWMHCVGVWRLITVPQSSKSDESGLLQCLERAFKIALSKYYCDLSATELKPEEILKMLTGLRISTLNKTKGKTEKVFRQIEYNTRKHHIIRAISSSQQNFSKEMIICVRKIQSTPTGQKVLQIVSTSVNEIDKKPKFFWIREDKFLQYFMSFVIISRRGTDSYWTNETIKIRNQQKAVYLIDSTEKHTSGSITLYPKDTNWGEAKPKCNIAFYKEIEPQVLKLVGKAMEKLPQSKELAHTSKLYFEFNIKGTYYVFFELDNGVYDVAIESNSAQTKLQFVEFVKKENNKNEQCEYVEIDKIFKKKPDVNTFQNSNEFKKLMNFMKKATPQAYQAK